MHTTNYYNTFIEVAEDCPVATAEMPPQKGDAKTVANLQFEMLNGKPYQFTSDEVLFSVFAAKNEVPEEELDAERQKFFSKGQACFRALPLTKRYGWGVHANEEGRIALVPLGSGEYETLVGDGRLKVVKAMRSKKG
ncbi:DUF6157 family protein [Rufibacter quisquiliarum]|uniref:Uncharacterized protein n=2 Tax=Rufibacter quisquiliarum TaxID=1549639 RepID=A0A839GBI2_9BACT|nr:hypothetical protein [Rufibacter quisquiliarum]